jgi:phosphoribosylformimino-5-aminoimidazole carboxamide ribotide isomerase
VSPTLYPAVDILGGRAVRLTRGSYEHSKVYEEEPLTAAQLWLEQGAEALHVVDLDGAREGRPVSLDHLRRIAELPLPVQYGGGLRSLDDVEAAADAGARWVVLGTAAFKTPGLLEAALERFNERVTVSVDVRGGRVATGGWLEQLDLPATDAVKELKERGARRFVYTNIDRDGTFEGVDLDAVSEVSTAVGDASFVFSGGIGSIGDLIDVALLQAGNLDGVIVGKALYEHRFRLGDGKRALEDPEGAAG